MHMFVLAYGSNKYSIITDIEVESGPTINYTIKAVNDSGAITLAYTSSSTVQDTVTEL